MNPAPRPPTLLNRVIQAQGLRNLRDLGRISEAEFLVSLNEIREAEGLPPEKAAEQSSGGCAVVDRLPV